jgi:hypothetical protein
LIDAYSQHLGIDCHGAKAFFQADNAELAKEYNIEQ